MIWIVKFQIFIFPTPAPTNNFRIFRSRMLGSHLLICWGTVLEQHWGIVPHRTIIRRTLARRCSNLTGKNCSTICPPRTHEICRTLSSRVLPSNRPHKIWNPSDSATLAALSIYMAWSRPPQCIYFPFSSGLRGNVCWVDAYSDEKSASQRLVCIHIAAWTAAAVSVDSQTKTHQLICTSTPQAWAVIDRALWATNTVQNEEKIFYR